MNTNLSFACCQNCATDFEITDFAKSVCERLHIPLPTWCGLCQMQRRLAWRNERTLHKRKSNEPGKDETLISLYREGSPVQTVYSHKYWQSDAWDPRDYAMDYDKTRPFFEQWKELYQKVPWPNLTTWNNVNCDYDNLTTDSKDCYLCFGGFGSEYVAYATFGFDVKQSSDLYFCNKAERCYECVDCSGCYNVRYSRYARSCMDSYFLYDCVNCTNCIGCVNLRNKSYCIFNEQYTKEDYFTILKSIDFGAHSEIEKLKEKFEAHVKKYPHRFAIQVQAKDSTGDNLSNVFDAQNCFDVEEGAQHIESTMIAGWNLKDALNTSHIGIGAELVYDSFGIFKGASNVICSLYCPTCVNCVYCYNCNGVENCFGCVGIKKGSYMILNKQYSKEDYFALVEQIKKDMTDKPYKDSKGRVYPFGQFFPAELSPFGYNETIANEYFPLTQDDAIKKGYRWHEASETRQQHAIEWSDVPDSIGQASTDLKNAIFKCQESGRVFKLSNLEWDLYTRQGIPLPRLHPEVRHKKRFALRGGIRLYEQSCDCQGGHTSGAYTNTSKHSHGDTPCSNIFKTVYAKGEFLLYCEECYLLEVL